MENIIINNEMTNDLIANNINYICKTLLKNIWNLKLDCPVIISGRMKSCFGKVTHSDITILSIKFSRDFLFGDYNDKVKISVIKHELCHYALIKQGLPHKDREYIFEKELKRVGAHSTNVIGNCGERYEVKCSRCGKVAGTVKESELNKYVDNTRRRQYVSRCCRAKFEIGKKIHVEDNTKILKPLDKSIEIIEEKLLNDLKKIKGKNLINLLDM